MVCKKIKKNTQIAKIILTSNYVKMTTFAT